MASTTADLASRLRAGDPEAKRAIFEAEGERIWSLAYRLCGDYDLAHDVVQETFLRAFRKADRYDGRGSLRGWLCRLAVNHLRDMQKVQRRRAALLVLAAAGAEHSAPPAAGEPFVRRRVHDAVGRLSEKYRTVLLMHDVEGYTHEEIGEALGIAAGSSRARLSRARALLKETLIDLAPEE
ncbi:MAG TPA: RNA polymerase sigma factor [Longimicrobiaceae bacterium]|nr:RNA polymerase sigma factor [Longimicrobiaceae bacterium]